MINRRIVLMFFLFLCLLAFHSARAASLNTYTITIHFQQPESDRETWSVWAWGQNRDGSQFEFDEADGFGKKVTFQIQSELPMIGFLIKNEDWDKNFKDDRFITQFKDNKTEIWLFSGKPEIYDQNPLSPLKKETKPAKLKTIRFHYQRPDANYRDWAVWIWWSGSEGKQYPFDLTDEWGAFTDIQIDEAAGVGGYIIKRRDSWEKDEMSENDRFFLNAVDTKEMWSVSGKFEMIYEKPLPPLKTTIELFGEWNREPVFLTADYGDERFVCSLADDSGSRMECPLKMNEVLAGHAYQISVRTLRNGKPETIRQFPYDFSSYKGGTLRYHMTSGNWMNLNIEQASVYTARLESDHRLILHLDSPVSEAVFDPSQIRILQNSARIVPVKWDALNGNTILVKGTIQTDAYDAGHLEAGVGKQMPVPVSQLFSPLPFSAGDAVQPGVFSRSNENQKTFTFRTWFPNAVKINVNLYSNHSTEPTSFEMVKNSLFWEADVPDRNWKSYQYEIRTPFGTVVLNDHWNPLKADRRSALPAKRDASQDGSAKSAQSELPSRQFFVEITDPNVADKWLPKLKAAGATGILIPAGAFGDEPGSDAWLTGINTFHSAVRADQLHLSVRFTGNNFERWDQEMKDAVSKLNGLTAGADLRNSPLRKDRFNRMIQFLQNETGITVYCAADPVCSEPDPIARLLMPERDQWFSHSVNEAELFERLQRWNNTDGHTSEYPVSLNPFTETNDLPSGAGPFAAIENAFPAKDSQKIKKLMMFLFQLYPGTVIARAEDLQLLNGIMPANEAGAPVSAVKLESKSIHFIGNNTSEMFWTSDSGERWRTEINWSVDPVIRESGISLSGLSMHHTPVRQSLSWIWLLLISLVCVAAWFIVRRVRK